MAEKRNPDYTASAVNLVNPPEVLQLLSNYHSQSIEIENVKKQIEACVPHELADMLYQLEEYHTRTNTALRKAIDEHGSYQDIEQGLYAVKQAKHTVSYEPKLVRDNLESKLADMVIIEAVDKVKLSGLVKGSFITQEQADKCGIARIDYAYIVK